MNNDDQQQPDPRAQPQQPPTGPIKPVEAPPQQPINPGYNGQPTGPAPDPSQYRPPDHPISSKTYHVPVWVYILIGVSFVAAVGLLIAVIVLMPSSPISS